jgi:seryl-tRNA synthetase
VSTGTTTSFRDEVLQAGLLVATGVDGVYLRSATYEGVAAAVADYGTRLGSGDDEEHVHGPPVMGRALFERTGYLASFPDLMGSVHTFAGGDRDHAALVDRAERGEEWATSLAPTEVMLCSAACHVVYPLCGTRLPDAGRRFCVTSWCFRHEPSTDLTRVQSFRMLEHVYVGDDDEALATRERWITRGREALLGLGLEVEQVAANDPFFGRAGRLLARSQRDDELKLEMVVPFYDDRPPVAIASSNLHLDHFGHDFGITTGREAVAHSTCFAFGIERVTLALLRRHGLDPSTWPTPVRRRLWP